MYRNLSKRRSQAISEYIVFFAAVLLGIIVLKVYFERGSAGYFKRFADTAGEQFSPHFSRYNEVTESSDFSIHQQRGDIEEMRDAQGNNQDFYEKTIQASAQISRVVDAEIDVTYNTAESLFPQQSLSNPQVQSICKQIGEEIPVEFIVGNSRSLIDDFSGRSLASDRIFEGVSR